MQDDYCLHLLIPFSSVRVCGRVSLSAFIAESITFHRSRFPFSTGRNLSGRVSTACLCGRHIEHPTAEPLCLPIDLCTACHNPSIICYCSQMRCYGTRRILDSSKRNNLYLGLCSPEPIIFSTSSRSTGLTSRLWK